jgi:macrolide-specific efflux system membrane fusion protein
MPVYFSTLGNSERRWNANVRQILPSPELINDVVLYNALIDVENFDGQLMSGMSTQLFFVIAKSENALLIPIQALGKRLKEKDSKVGKAYSIKTKKAEKIIHTGLVNRSFVEVLDGLDIEDEVERSVEKEGSLNSANKPRARPAVL